MRITKLVVTRTTRKSWESRSNYFSCNSYRNKQKQNVSNSSYGKGYKYTTQKDAEYKSQLKADDQNSSYSIQPDHYKVGQDYFSQSKYHYSYVLGHGGGLNKYREDRNSKGTSWFMFVI